MRRKENDEKWRGTGERGAGALVRIFNKVRSGIPDLGIPSDLLILIVFVDSGASSITERNAIWR